ncbi:hypothetical protein HN587_03915 [Candidatus Woesearchaeota archaeon]|jgi:hypothetical protein|nr:hypothetical protein [Candidatus Woesearchaeota archaeon]
MVFTPSVGIGGLDEVVASLSQLVGLASAAVGFGVLGRRSVAQGVNFSNEGRDLIGSESERPLKLMMYDPNVQLEKLVERLSADSDSFEVSLVRSYDEMFSRLQQDDIPDVFFTGLLPNLPTGVRLDGLKKITHYAPLLTVVSFRDIISMKDYSPQELSRFVSDNYDIDFDVSSLSDEDFKLFTSEISMRLRLAYGKNAASNLLLVENSNFFRMNAESIYFKLQELERVLEKPVRSNPALRRDLEEAAYSASNRLFFLRPGAASTTRFFYETMTEGATEGGATRVRHPSKGFKNTEWHSLVLKKLSRERAKRAKADSDFFNDRYDQEGFYSAGEVRLRVERIKPVLSSRYIDRAFLWKEFIPGIDFNSVLIWAQKEEKLGKNSSATKLKNALYDYVANAILSWQNHAPDVEEHKHPELVRNAYRKNLIRSLEVFETHTDLNLTSLQRQFYSTCVQDIPFETFINERTIRRKADASFRNYMLGIETRRRDGVVSGISDVYSAVSNRGEISSKAVSDAAVLIDTPSKYAFILEDMFEMLDHAEGGLKQPKKRALRHKFEQAYVEHAKDVREGYNLTRFYRSIRKAFFFVHTYGLRAFEKLELGEITPREFESKKKIYHKHIVHYLRLASNALNTEIDRLSSKYFFDREELVVDGISIYSVRKKSLSDFTTQLHMNEIKTIDDLIDRSVEGSENLIAKRRIVQFNYLHMVVRTLAGHGDFSYSPAQLRDLNYSD